MSPFYVDVDQPANATILKILNTGLGDPAPVLVTHFEKYTEMALKYNPGAIGQINRYPVFSHPECGVIVAAVCGPLAVALRFTLETSRQKALDKGAMKTIHGDQGVIDLGEEWIFTDGSLDLQMVRGALPESYNFYDRQQQMARMKASLLEAQARSIQSPVKADQPSNMALITHYQTLYPEDIISMAPPEGYGRWGLGFQPDVVDYVWDQLPKQANLPAGMGWVVRGQLVLVHPASGIIFACVDRTGKFCLRLPEAQVAECCQRAFVMPFTELGKHWIRFPLFDLQKDSIIWLGLAYHFAG